MSGGADSIRETDAQDIVRLAVEATREWRRRAERSGVAELIPPGDAKAAAWSDALGMAGRLIRSAELLGAADARLKLASAAGLDGAFLGILGRAQQQLLLALERLLRIHAVDDGPFCAELRVAVKQSRNETEALVKSWKSGANAVQLEAGFGELAGLQKKLSERLAKAGPGPLGESMTKLAGPFGAAAGVPSGMKPGFFNRRKYNRQLAKRGRTLLQPLADLHQWLGGQLPA